MSAMEHWTIPDTGLPQHFAVDEEGDLIFKSARHHGSCDIKVSSIVERVKNLPHHPRTPLILRFNGILYSSMSKIHESFRKAMEAYDYPGAFQTVFQYIYPIKVSYEAPVLDRVLEYGAEFGIGLEAGSSAEFALAVQKAASRAGDTTVLFDGYKQTIDLEFAMESESVGCRTIIVVGDLEQLRLTINFARLSGWCPSIALRIRLQTPGAGRWAKSCGMDSKFGLSRQELERALVLLKQSSMLLNVVLVHFHPGSQVTRLAQIEQAVQEGIDAYVHLRTAGAEHLRVLDCGGGLGAQGSIQTSNGETDYDLENYASAVVRTVLNACHLTGVEPPKIMVESGRALVAQHAMLVFELLSVRTRNADVDADAESKRQNPGTDAASSTDGDDIAICGVSMFRSMMDYFVAGETYRLLPIQRLNEQPSHLVRIHDITADSDGEIDRFPGGKSRLPIHRQSEGPYYLAVMNVGAYHNALACPHNLFGRVHGIEIPPMDGPWAGSEITVTPGSTIGVEIGQQGHVATTDPFLVRYLNRSTYPECQRRSQKL